MEPSVCRTGVGRWYYRVLSDRAHCKTHRLCWEKVSAEAGCNLIVATVYFGALHSSQRARQTKEQEYH